MLRYEYRSDQQLDTDEEKEEPTFVLPGMFGEGELVRGNEEGENREDKQEDSHG